MADARWQRTWEIFHAALECEGASRAAFVAAECGDDAELLDEVNALLVSLGRSDFLERSLTWLAGAEALGDLAAGSRIGAYTIRRLIGRGGMGEVYEAEQQGDITRRVALKLVRSGMASREILARFAIERQALALMNHPNIATAYDVGVTTDGRPYFAMECVDGQPLTKFSDAHALTIAERVRLFLQVCDAVEHAHQKGILHRDLKPSNVLAGRDGGRTILKVIDFGVAKATGPRAGTFVTEVGRFIGTPEYMSPEQAGVSRLDVDTRADIYSLGVLLYELLAGVLPVEPERLRSASFAEIERLLFVDDLPRPSQRAPVPAIARQLRGDLDSIVGRAMEKDRERRYPSVSELAADLKRCLANEPIVARPASTAYRVRKFVRRHRAGVAAAALLILTSIGFVISLVLSNARAERALQDARVERARSDQVSAFLTNLFRVSKPSTAAANATTARELLDKGAADIRAQLGNQPVVQARLMETMGGVYTNLGNLDQAEALLTDALEVRRRTLGPDHPDVADSLAWLARLHNSQGRHKESLARHREALAIFQRVTPPDLDDISTAQHNVGGALRIMGELDAAEQSLQQALAIRTEQMKVEDQTVANTLISLGNVELAGGELAGAERYHRRAADLMLRLLGEGHVEVARARNELAIVLFRKGDAAGAITAYRQVLATYTAVHGEDHSNVATAKSNLASALRPSDPAAAEVLHREALATRRRQLGNDHPDVAVSLNNVGLLLRAKGESAAGAVMLRDAHAIMRKVYGDNHPNVTQTLGNLAEVLHESGAPDAEQTLEASLAQRRRTLPASNPTIAVSLSMLAHARAERGDAKGAEPLLREALAAMQKTWKDDNLRVAQAKAYLGGALADLRRYEEAEPLLRESQKLLAKSGSAHDRAYVERQLARRPAPK
jgi:serine/threonine protein kinase/tetratricopeptide (TPR) repeat protein